MIYACVTAACRQLLETCASWLQNMLPIERMDPNCKLCPMLQNLVHRSLLMSSTNRFVKLLFLFIVYLLQSMRIGVLYGNALKRIWKCIEYHFEIYRAIYVFIQIFLLQKHIHFALQTQRTQCNIDQAGNSCCCCKAYKKRDYWQRVPSGVEWNHLF